MRGEISATRVSAVRLALPVAILTAATVGCGRPEPGALPPPEEAASVAVSSPAPGGEMLGFPATAEAARRADLSTRMSGRIARITVDVGSRVEAGQVLVEMDAGDVDAAIVRAEAAVRQATRTFERLEALERDGAATAQELDDARAAREMAEAELKQAGAQRGYAILEAPFGGWVKTRMADPGDLAIPGRPILTLIADGAIKVVADVPAELGSRLGAGDPLTVWYPAARRRYDARITRLAPAVQTEARLLRVEATLEPASPLAPSVLPGAYLRLEVGGGTGTVGESTLWVPEDALIRRGQLTGVWLVEGDQLRLRWIRPGQRRGGAVEVLAGLMGGEHVVRRPTPGLADGQQVGQARLVEWSPSLTGEAAAAGAMGRDAGLAEEPVTPDA